MTGSDDPTRLWSPAAPDDTINPFDETVSDQGDHYVTVDEIDGERARLVVSPWPSVDSDGLLRFPTPESGHEELLDDPTASEVVITLARLQQVVDRERTKRGQPAPDRPIRVGDTFWVRGSIENWPRSRGDIEDEIIDITFAARGEAKAAMAWAVTGSTMVSPDLLTAAAVLDDEDRKEVPPPESVVPARPAVPGSTASPSI